jgi:uncharacterized protein
MNRLYPVSRHLLSVAFPPRIVESNSGSKCISQKSRKAFHTAAARASAPKRWPATTREHNDEQNTHPQMESSNRDHTFCHRMKVHDILNTLQWYRGFRHQWLHLANMLLNIAQMLFLSLGVSATYRVGPEKVLEELGLSAPAGRAFGFAFLASLPMLVLFACSATPHLSVIGLVTWTLIAPLTEELGFRGYLFRQLYRRAGWGFWPAALLNSVLFALIHVYQAFFHGFDALELVGILAITGFGGWFFSWLFVRWQDNLWVPIAMHIFMNAWWELFAIDKTAVGGWIANGARLLTIALAIGLTIYKDRIWKRSAIGSSKARGSITRDEQCTNQGFFPIICYS